MSTSSGRPQEHNWKLGEGSIPRSLGAVLWAIRSSLGLSQEEMLHRLKETESPYPFPRSRSEGTSKHPGARVSNWERARDNVPFSVQHRYGTITKTFSGVLHLISLFYANFRDAADPTIRAARLAENVRVAKGLLALAEAVILEAENFSPSEKQDESVDEIGPPRVQIILALLNEYSKGAGNEVPRSIL